MKVNNKLNGYMPNQLNRKIQFPYWARPPSNIGFIDYDQFESGFN